tara:strand:- start:987 stop:1250 length:264 start_codon:yes stop_codon:yes gene_type:complete
MFRPLKDIQEIKLELIKTIARLEWIRDELRPIYRDPNKHENYTKDEIWLHNYYYHEIGTIRYNIKKLIGHSMVTTKYRADNERSETQ